MHDASSGGEPLHVAITEARCGAKRIGVVYEALANNRHRFESSVRMRRESGNRLAVIHAPAILAGEVLSDVAPSQRRVGAKPAIATRIRVVVMDAQQKRVNRIPGKTEGALLNDRARFHSHLQRVIQYLPASKRVACSFRTWRFTMLPEHREISRWPQSILVLLASFSACQHQTFPTRSIVLASRAHRKAFCRSITARRLPGPLLL